MTENQQETARATDARWDALAALVARLGQSITRLRAHSRKFSLARLAIMLAGIAAGYMAFRFGGDLAGWGVTVAVVALFVVVAHFHSRLEQGIRRRAMWRMLRQIDMARAAHNWADIPPPPDFPPEPEHPYDRDVNITGERSLLHLIDTGVSVGGSALLRGWLLERNPQPEEARRRQGMVRELLLLRRFRERLALHAALLAGYPGKRWQGKRLMDWMQNAELRAPLTGWLAALVALGGVNVALGTLHAMGLLGPVWIATLLLYATLYLYKRGEFENLFGEATELDARLGELRGVFLWIEQQRFPAGSGLAALCAPFHTDEGRPSAQLREAGRIAAAASVQGNPLLRFLCNVVVPWDLYFAHRLNNLRKRFREHLPLWLERWYELEALGSLANFATLNPGYTFPEIADAPGAGGELLTGTDMGHPLLPDTERVGNDAAVGGAAGKIAIITGSNMSGKSTFLRTLGTNTALAFAGGPVCATAMRVAPLRLYACMNVSDSVNDGISYFYAEVRRLKALLEEANRQNEPPLLFLIDEIFRGTNNRERLIGSRAYVRALATANGAGLISTHDLELVSLADEVPGIVNFHFREWIAGNRMTFDYQLRTGPCPTTNALQIMRLEGLPVDEPPTTTTHK